jgi:hypothetical protein
MRSNLRFIAAVVFILVSLPGCGGDDDEGGACVSGTGVSAQCRDDYSSGQCQLINAEFHAGTTCAALGFR